MSEMLKGVTKLCVYLWLFEVTHLIHRPT